MRVNVYWNLHKGCYSLRAMEGRHKGRVIVHADRVMIRDARFVVGQAGRDRVLATGHKNVHAYVRGELEAFDGHLVGHAARDPWMPATAPVWSADEADYVHFATMEGAEVTYNPYRFDSFMEVARDYDEHHDVPVTLYRPIHAAPMAYLKRRRGKAEMYAFDPCDMPEREAA